MTDEQPQCGRKSITIIVTADDYEDVHDEIMLADFLEYPRSFSVELVKNGDD